MKKTKWFEPEQKPELVGVYETDHGHRTCYQHWNGRFWGFYMDTVEGAAKKKNDRSAFQRAVWRGLASDPNA